MVGVSWFKKKKMTSSLGNKAARTFSTYYARITAMYLNLSEAEGVSYNM